MTAAAPPDPALPAIRGRDGYRGDVVMFAPRFPGLRPVVEHWSPTHHALAGLGEIPNRR
jgi:hypothetical protein